MSAERYADINARTYPALTMDVAECYVRKLLRVFGKPADAAMRPVLGFGGVPENARMASHDDLMRAYRNWAQRHFPGVRRCWASTKPTVGHDKGLGRLIHDVSHIIHEFRHPKERQHGHLHAGIEREVMEYVHAQGWNKDTPKVIGPSLHQRRAAKYCQLAERLERWVSKANRAENAIRKIKRRMRALERLQNMGRQFDKAAPGRMPTVFGDTP